MDPHSPKSRRPTVERSIDETARRKETVSAPATGGTPPPKYPFLSPPECADEIGRLGPYRVLSELGRGGMGAVFRVEDQTLKRQLAVKVMAPHLAADPRSKARFIREAQAQAGVEHDHIIPIFHIGEANGVPFIAMPLLKGRALAEALGEGERLPIGEVLRVGREIAEGLAAAHAAGLVHRDIKPANVWLEGTRGRVKILDFGLARAITADTDTDDQLTVTGAVIGTPTYMSPEQANAQPVDHRTDLWSLGVVLYEMATGHRPFTGPSRHVVLYAVTETEPTAPGELASDIPPALSALIQRLLAKDPTARPQTAEEVAEELTRLERAPRPTPAPAVSPAATAPAIPKANENALAHLNARPSAKEDEEQDEEQEEEETPRLRRKRKAGRGRAKKKSSLTLMIAAVVFSGAIAIGLVVLIAQASKPKTKVVEAPTSTSPKTQIVQVPTQPVAQSATPAKNPSPTTQNDPAAAAREVQAQALNNRISLLLASGEVDEALAAYDQLITLLPNNPDIKAKRNALIAEWKVKDADHQKARGYLLKTWPAIATIPDFTASMPALHAAIDVCQKNGDKLTFRKLLSGFQQATLKLNDLTANLDAANANDRKLLADANSVRKELSDLEEKIVAFLSSKKP